MYFCLECQQNDPTLKDKSLPELVALCDPEWTRMSREERDPYVETARGMSEGNYEPTFSSASIENSQDLAGKFDAYGRSYVALRSKVLQDKCK